jgi:hypothetical protein
MPGTMLSSFTKGVTRPVPLGSHDNAGRISQVGSLDFLGQDFRPASTGDCPSPHIQSCPRSETTPKWLSARLTGALVAVYLFIPRRRMGRYLCSQVFSNVAYFLLCCFVADFRPLVIGGFFKLVASLAFACLLAFVVVHSANICRLLIACLHVLPVCFFPLVVDRRWAERSNTSFVVPNEPSLSPFFQRPPPILSV